VRGRFLALTAPEVSTLLTVRDISFRGFSVETDAPVTVGILESFVLSTAGGPTLEAIAIAVYCRRIHGRVDKWISGWEFAWQDGLDEQVDRVIEFALGDLVLD
jgi:hypothetical protein